MGFRLILRLTAPLVAVSLLLLAVGVVAAWHVQQLQQNVSETLRVSVSSMRAAEEVEISIREFRTQHLDRFVNSGRRKYLQASAEFRQETAHWLGVAERLGVTPHEQQLMNQAREGYQRLMRELDDLAGQHFPEVLPPGKERDVLVSQVRRLIEEVLVQEVLTPVHQYLDYNEVEADKSLERNQKQVDRLAYVLLSLGICGCGAGLVAGFAIARGISRSLIQLSVPIRAAAGQLDEVVGPITFQAGTDLHQLEGVLRSIAERIGEVVERLRQSERERLRNEQLAAVGQMAAGMAHELRNPLTSMKLLVQSALAADAQEPGLEGRDLRVLEEEISRLEDHIQSFLQFARPPRLEKRPVDLRPLVEQTVSLVQPRARLCDARIECRLPAGPVPAVVDPGQVRQVLLNLLLNSLDAIASSPGPRSVQVGVEQVEQGINLVVSDTGCGLPVVLGTRIFTPFVTTKETGMGLGLSICKRIAEAHGGSIEAANLPEGGAVFTVRLPAENRTQMNTD